METTFNYSQHLPGDEQRKRAISAIKLMLFSASVIPALVSGAVAYSLESFDITSFFLLVAALFIGQAGAITELKK